MKDNPRERSSFATLALALVLFLTLPLAAYVAGYFWLGEYDSGENDDGAVENIARDYPQQNGWLTFTALSAKWNPKGYLVLRRGKPIGGIVHIVS
jgi:hypothetical protein